MSNPFPIPSPTCCFLHLPPSSEQRTFEPCLLHLPTKENVKWNGGQCIISNVPNSFLVWHQCFHLGFGELSYIFLT